MDIDVTFEADGDDNEFNTIPSPPPLEAFDMSDEELAEWHAPPSPRIPFNI